jgi:hypothetical protein
MPRSRKVNLEKVKASRDKTCPKCGAAITPERVKRLEFNVMECPVAARGFERVLILYSLARMVPFIFGAFDRGGLGLLGFAGQGHRMFH